MLPGLGPAPALSSPAHGTKSRKCLAREAHGTPVLVSASAQPLGAGQPFNAAFLAFAWLSPPASHFHAANLHAALVCWFSLSQAILQPHLGEGYKYSDIFSVFQSKLASAISSVHGSANREREAGRKISVSGAQSCSLRGPWPAS